MSVEKIQSDFNYLMYHALGVLVGHPNVRGFNGPIHSLKSAAGLALIKIKHGLTPENVPPMTEDRFLEIVTGTLECDEELHAVIGELQGVKYECIRHTK